VGSIPTSGIYVLSQARNQQSQRGRDMFSSIDDVAVPIIILLGGLMQFALRAGAAFVGSLLALKWHERRRA
jgi:hypothetical protein